MPVRPTLRVPASVLLLASMCLLVAGCGGSGDDGGSSSSSIPTTSLTVALSGLPPDAGPTAVLQVLQCSGAICETLGSATGPAETGTILGVDVDTSPYDLLVYVSDDPNWSVGDPMGEGYYAAANGLSSTEGNLWVSYWEYRESRDTVGSGTILDGDEEPTYGSLSGAVVDSTLQPLAGATVWVERQALTVTGEDGTFTLEPLPLGEVTVFASAPGFGVLEQTVTVGGEMVALPVQAADDEEPRTVRGVVRDSATDEPLEGVTVEAGGTVVTTDADGAFETTVPPGTFHARLTLDAYAIHVAGIVSCDTDDDGALQFTMDPLPEDFFGVWEYCYSEDESGERFDAVVAGTDDPNDVAQQVWAFDESGLFDSTAWGSRALGSAAPVRWNVVQQGDRHNLVRALDSFWCEPFHASEISPYWWFEPAEDELVYVRSFRGENRHHYVEDAGGNAECASPDEPEPDPEPQGDLVLTVFNVDNQISASVGGEQVWISPEIHFGAAYNETVLLTQYLSDGTQDVRIDCLNADADSEEENPWNCAFELSDGADFVFVSEDRTAPDGPNGGVTYTGSYQVTVVDGEVVAVMP